MNCAVVYMYPFGYNNWGVSFAQIWGGLLPKMELDGLRPFIEQVDVLSRCYYVTSWLRA
jgi:hypothetical protein